METPTGRACGAPYTTKPNSMTASCMHACMRYCVDKGTVVGGRGTKRLVEDGDGANGLA